ncbi:uncharacterized protein EV154DRAFT_585007 [Mucor mucedo]|uniref:uncharacterized protein n=1 Tax=Mucor mucedo TaxID=29922 RepID=UPI002220C2D4|nr:uncharacterized protein EV154DRAFT_585007 [Mucor mucedo]KAI7896806.1 hypothetical protein EV154DRAFT_585007 [Mucor mucedo]
MSNYNPYQNFQINNDKNNQYRTTMVDASNKTDADNKTADTNNSRICIMNIADFLDNEQHPMQPTQDETSQDEELETTVVSNNTEMEEQRLIEYVKCAIRVLYFDFLLSIEELCLNKPVLFLVRSKSEQAQPIRSASEEPSARTRDPSFGPSSPVPSVIPLSLSVKPTVDNDTSSPPVDPAETPRIHRTSMSLDREAAKILDTDNRQQKSSNSLF